MIFPEIKSVLDALDTTAISKERKLVLAPLRIYIRTQLTNKNKVQLNFICTHNSRRSIFSQVWAQTIATYFKLENIHCFSGGTETTSLYPMVATTLKNAGFRLELITEGENPVYKIQFSTEESPIKAFSKTYDFSENPVSNFAAILTCSNAEENCPFIKGAEVRIPITYEDPKISDETSKQESVYRERSLEIATELKYVFSRI